MTFGALLFSLAVWLIVRPEMTLQLWLFGILGGFIWSIGQTGQFHAMQYMGVSVANPLSSGSQLVLGSLIGVLVFHEWTRPMQFVVGSLALLLLIVGFTFLVNKMMLMHKSITFIIFQKDLGRSLIQQLVT